MAIIYSYQNDNVVDNTERGLVTAISTMYNNGFYLELFDYDMYGNVIRYFDKNGDAYHYTYDFRNSDFLMTSSNINGAESIIYSYDTYGKLRSMTNAAGMTEVNKNTNNYQYSFGGLNYSYNYSSRGNISSIQRNSSDVITYGYDTRDNLTTKTFANNQEMEYTYYTYGNLKTKKSYTGTTQDAVDFTYNYNVDGNLESVAYDGYTKSYTYPNYTQDTLEFKTTIQKSGQSNYLITRAYDKLTELYQSTTYNINGANRNHNVYYMNSLKGIIGTESDGLFNSSYGYRDDFIPSFQQVNLSSAAYSRTYNMNNYGSQITSMDDLVTYPGASVTFKSDIYYTNAGNINNITRTNDNAKFNDVTYTYDNAGRVRTEKNTVFGKEYLYEYDTNNNIKYVTEYNTNGTVYNRQTYNYSYDRLTSITNSNFLIGTRNFSTDALGNHINYSGFNLSWTRGRLLDGITDSVGTNVSFKYNENGIRYEKTLTTSAGAGYNVQYYLDGSTIIAEDRNGTLIHYYYNQTGVIGMRYGGVDYLFLKDALGSITEIINSSGGIYAQYVYDAWGNTVYKSTGGLTDINPFRYRGYYMDTETGWYYLQTRYYDPVVRRFINADTYELIPQLAQNIGELNLYSYCNNNPVMFTDSSGQSVILTAILIGALVGAVIGGTIGGVKAAANDTSIIGGILGGAIMGAAMGGLLAFGGGAALGLAGGIGLGGGLLISSGVGVLAGWASYSVEAGINGTWNALDFGIAGIAGAFQGMLTFGMGFMGGKLGAFDKLLLKPLMSGMPQTGKGIAFAIGKEALGRTVFMQASTEFMFKIGFSGAAALGRAGIDWLWKLLSES